MPAWSAPASRPSGTRRDRDVIDYEAAWRERNRRDVAKAYREAQYAKPVTCELCLHGDHRACVRLHHGPQAMSGPYGLECVRSCRPDTATMPCARCVGILTFRQHVVVGHGMDEGIDLDSARRLHDRAHGRREDGPDQYDTSDHSHDD